MSILAFQVVVRQSEQRVQIVGRFSDHECIFQTQSGHVGMTNFRECGMKGLERLVISNKNTSTLLHTYTVFQYRLYFFNSMLLPRLSFIKRKPRGYPKN